MSIDSSKSPAAALDTNNWVEFDQDGYHIRALAPFQKFRGLDIPWENREELDASTERVVKASRSRKVVKLNAGQYGLPVEIYVKRYNFRSWLRLLLRAGRRSRAREEMDLGWQLITRGIKTPRPVWLADSHGAVSSNSLIATEALPDAESALERWLRLPTESARTELLVALGRFTGQVHDAGFFHDDYKPAHMLILPDRPAAPREFYLIDLLGGTFPRMMTEMRRARNLYQLIRAFCPKKAGFDFHFKPAHRRILLEAYAGSTGEADKWSKWVDRVGRIKGRQV